MPPPASPSREGLFGSPRWGGRHGRPGSPGVCLHVCLSGLPSWLHRAKGQVGVILQGQGGSCSTSQGVPDAWPTTGSLLLFPSQATTIPRGRCSCPMGAGGMVSSHIPWGVSLKLQVRVGVVIETGFQPLSLSPPASPIWMHVCFRSVQ